MSGIFLHLLNIRRIEQSRVLSSIVLALDALERRLSPTERAARKANPQDYAFSVYSEWGPNSRAPRLERLRQEFPGIPDTVLNEWIDEFGQVEKVVSQLASAGGPQVLGDATTREQLKARFPFLAERGLSAAMVRASYYAWHEGLDVLAERRKNSG